MSSLVTTNIRCTLCFTNRFKISLKGVLILQVTGGIESLSVVIVGQCIKAEEGKKGLHFGKTASRSLESNQLKLDSSPELQKAKKKEKEKEEKKKQKNKKRMWEPSRKA